MITEDAITCYIKLGERLHQAPLDPIAPGLRITGVSLSRFANNCFHNDFHF